MASMAFTSSLPKLQTTNKLSVIKPSTSSRVFLPASTTSNFHVNRRYVGVRASYDESAKQASDAAEKGLDAAKKSGLQVQEDAGAALDNAGEKIKDVTGNVSESAEDAAAKAKQSAEDATAKLKETAENAWESAKETAQNIKDTVVSHAEATADGAKAAIEEAKK